MNAQAAPGRARLMKAASRNRPAPIPIGSGQLQSASAHSALERAADEAAVHATGLSAPSSFAARWDRPTAEFAPRIAARVAETPGRRLDSSLRESMETRLDADFSAVRVHTGPIAERATQALSARAFAFGPHLVFGAGQYDPVRGAGRRLIAHELAHCLQQQSGAGQQVQCDAVDQIQDKLSYKFLDWAIRDGEAVDSLNLLAAMADAELSAALNRLGSKYIDRLLDNLPDSAKTGPGYQRVLAAIGNARTLGYASEQLEYGLFDWAITDAEAGRVLNLFSNLPAAEHEAFLLGLERAHRLGRLFDNATPDHYTQHILPWVRTLPRGRLSAEQRSILRRLVENAPPAPIDILQTATEIRYDVSVGPSTIPNRPPAPWNPEKLRITYLALDDLPEAHVARNRELVRFGQFSMAQTQGANNTSIGIVSGTYDSSVQELAINAEDIMLPPQRDANGQLGPPVKADTDLPGTLIHETAHAVDQEMGWSTGPEPANASRGGWRTFPDHTTCATEMVGDSSGAIAAQLDAAQRAAVVGNMVSAMGLGNVGSLERDIRANPWFPGLADDKRSAVLADPALDALRIGIATGPDAPWFVADKGGRHLGPHVYQQSYQPVWVRYRHEALIRRVSPYQFRDPAEWFAECYAAYYRPDPRGKGAKLDDKDSDTKLYFDKFVDTRPASR